MKAYKTIDSIKGPLVFINRTAGVGYQELVTIKDAQGRVMQGQVIALENDTALVQLFKDGAGLQIDGGEAVFAGEPKKFALSPAILGRTFDGGGNPLDDLGTLEGEEVDLNLGLATLPNQYRDINGAAINPYRRAEPYSYIQTGVSTIDLTNTIVKGQKIPIFSGSGLPDLELLAQIATSAKTNEEGDKFVVVVAGMGITNDQYTYLRGELEASGSLARTVMFINRASDSIVERILTPRLALTASEYLAYELGYSVLTLMFDLTNYANAMREISASKNEIPGRSGYPGYMYTDLALLLERAGTVEGKAGSITQIPILTMPNDDKTHVVPDLTGYITEGQIVLSRALHKKGITPPVDILGSLSRLKDKGQGEGKTREDHDKVADQIFAALAESNRQQELALVLGRDSLSPTGQKYLDFNEAYFERFVSQGKANRDILETLTIAWDILSILPREELKKIKDPLIQKYKPEILNKG